MAYFSEDDTFWGTGISRFSQDANTPTHWPGKNLLGLALERLREHLATRPEYQKEMEEIREEKATRHPPVLMLDRDYLEEVMRKFN